MKYEQNNQLINYSIRKVSILCSILILLLVFFVQVAWQMGLQNLSSFGKNFIPMADETAFVFVLLSIASILLNSFAGNKLVRRIILLINTFSIFVSFLTLIDVYTHYTYNLSDFIFRETSEIKGVITGKMSGLTAFCFICCSISQLFILKNHKQISVYFSVFVLCFAYIMLVGYAYGVPFFYNKGFIPIAWPSSLCFFLFASSLLFAAGKETAPLSFFIGNSTRALMMRNLMPILFITISINNFIDIYFLNTLSNSVTFAKSIVDIGKLIVVGLIISIVSKKIGTRIDTIIEELTLYKNKASQLSQAVEHSPISIIIADLAGNILFANNKFVEVSGYTKEEVIGKNPRVLKSGYTSEAEYKNLWETITAGKNWKGEFKNKKKNGTYYWESASIYPIKNDQNEILQFLAIKEDISEHKKITAKLKNIAWQQSHEIRGPLTSIMGIIRVINLCNTIEEKIALLGSLDEAAHKLDKAIRSIVNETQH